MKKLEADENKKKQDEKRLIVLVLTYGTRNWMNEWMGDGYVNEGMLFIYILDSHNQQNAN